MIQHLRYDSLKLPNEKDNSDRVKDQPSSPKTVGPKQFINKNKSFSIAGKKDQFQSTEKSEFQAINHASELEEV